MKLANDLPIDACNTTLGASTCTPTAGAYALLLERIQDSQKVFSDMAASFQVVLPPPELFYPGSLHGLTVALDMCPALTNLDLGSLMTLDAAFIDSLPRRFCRLSVLQSSTPEISASQ